MKLRRAIGIVMVVIPAVAMVFFGVAFRECLREIPWQVYVQALLVLAAGYATVAGYTALVKRLLR